MKRENAVLLTLALAALILMGGVLGMRFRLKGAWQEWNALGQRRADISAMLNTLAVRRTSYLEALEDVEKEIPDIPEWRDLQTQAQDVLRNNDVAVLEGQGKTDRLNLAFQGKYHDVVQVLAAWRALPLKLAALTLRRAGVPPSSAGNGSVEAYATLEPLQ